MWCHWSKKKNVGKAKSHVYTCIPTTHHMAKRATKIHVQYTHEADVVWWDQFPYVIEETNLIFFWWGRNMYLFIGWWARWSDVSTSDRTKSRVWRIKSRRARNIHHVSSWCLHAEHFVRQAEENIASQNDAKPHTMMSFLNLGVLILLSGFCTPPLGWKR